MEENVNKTDKRFWLGGLLILLGALFLFNSFDIIDFRISRIIFSWPFFFLVIGTFILINTEKKVFGGILSGLGAIFMLPKIFPGIHYDGTIVIAVILIGLGLYIVLKRSDRKEKDEMGFYKKDLIDDVSIFGGGTKIITSDNFKGGNVTSIFGGSEINLKGCKLAEGTNTVDVLCIFGGTTLIVPNDWNVILNVTSILGGFSDKSIKDPNLVIDKSKTLIVKGLALFGGGEIKTYL